MGIDVFNFISTPAFPPAAVHAPFTSNTNEISWVSWQAVTVTGHLPQQMLHKTPKLSPVCGEIGGGHLVRVLMSNRVKTVTQGAREL